MLPKEYAPLPKEAQNLTERTETLEKGYRKFAENCARHDDYWHAGQIMVMLGIVSQLHLMVKRINEGIQLERREKLPDGIRETEGGQTSAL